VATYSEDGLWMWNEESSKWIPSPPSSNNAIETFAPTVASTLTPTVASNVNSNETYCKNCGKLVYQGWKKCTSCGVLVESLLRETPTTNPFDNQFSNPFQKENDELLDSAIKNKIKTRKKIAATIFSLMGTVIITAAGAGTFTPDCHQQKNTIVEWDGGEPRFVGYEYEQVCEERQDDPVGLIIAFMAVMGLMGGGIIPVSIKYWRYSFPSKSEIFKRSRQILVFFSLIVFFLWAINTGWF
jgi:ribosomal protein L37E